MKLFPGCPAPALQGERNIFRYCLHGHEYLGECRVGSRSFFFLGFFGEQSDPRPVWTSRDNICCEIKNPGLLRGSTRLITRTNTERCLSEARYTRVLDVLRSLLACLFFGFLGFKSLLTPCELCLCSVFTCFLACLFLGVQVFRFRVDKKICYKFVEKNSRNLLNLNQMNTNSDKIKVLSS